jgi:hypothetical protein
MDQRLLMLRSEWKRAGHGSPRTGASKRPYCPYSENCGCKPASARSTWPGLLENRRHSSVTTSREREDWTCSSCVKSARSLVSLFRFSFGNSSSVFNRSVSQALPVFKAGACRRRFASRAATALRARSERRAGDRERAAFLARALRSSGVSDAAAFLPPRLPSFRK